MVEGEGDDQLWGSGRGAIAVCYGRARGGTNFGGVDVVPCWVPLQGAIVVCYGGGRGWCHCRVPVWSARRVTANFESGRGAIAGCRGTCCHCWVPLQGAIAGCHCRVPF